MPRISGSFDFFFGGATATGGNALGGCGNGGAGARGGIDVCGTAVGGEAGGAGGGRLEDVTEPVGPVFLGKTAVGADEGVAMVALKSGVRLLAGVSGAGSTGSARLAEP